ncbi:YfhO family protein [bacterium]|nr:YfhO family protein [bacterium]
MAKRAKKQNQPETKPSADEEKRKAVTGILRESETAFLFPKRSLVGDIVAIAALYVVTLILFWNFVVEPNRFSVSGDAFAARAWNDVGAEIDAQVDGPAAWNPYVFLGFPTYGSLAYHPDSWLNPANWLDIPGRFLFGPHDMNKQIFYYFLSGLLMYLFARGVGLPWWASLLAGLTFLLNPYNLSLAEAGHGSKHWTIAMLPLTLLLTHRVLTKRRLLELALLALGTAALLLSMHAQIAYYGLLTGGLYALAWFIRELLRDRAVALRGVAGYAGGTALGLLLSAFVYWPIYVFSKYSIRGTGPLRDEGGASGLDWTYATNWSLHPLESLQFLVPGWFGLGGSAPPDRMLTVDTALNYNLYWGWMPFTTSSLYMGIIPLLLAILAGIWLWKKSGVVRWMSIAAVLAWIVSFGRFLPVLYGPMYYALPFFNKFRVPSMALVITALGVSLLAAYGLAELVKRLIAARDDDKRRAGLSRLFTVVLIVAIAGFALAVFMPGPMDTFLKDGETRQYDAQTLQYVLELRWQIFTATLLVTAFILAIFALSVRLSLRKTLAFLLPTSIAVAIIFTGYDLFTIDQRFLHPVPERALTGQLQESSAVQYIKQQQFPEAEPFRIFPVGNDFQNNTWMYHRIQSIGGYGANKLRVYQDLLDYAFYSPQGQPNLALAGMMNARYLVSGQPLGGNFQQVHADEQNQQYVYFNPFATPRVWFVDNVEVIEDPDDVMTAIAREDFQFTKNAIVMETPEFMPVPGDSARHVQMSNAEFGPHEYNVEIRNTEPGFIVLSEIWYPQGWYAELNGEPVEFMRTNYALRGLPVPPGEHTLHVYYDPPEVKAGFMISRIAMAITLLLLAFSLIQIFRTRQAPVRKSDA